MMRNHDLLLVTLGLLLATGCDPGGEGTGSDSEADSEADSDAGDSTGDPTTGAPTTGDPTADSGSTDEGDPCEACDALATCEAGVCVCPDGYDGDGTACADVDECATGAAGCDANATCTNLEGSFECACDDGFVGDGQQCEAVESCADDPCDANATCDDGDDGPTCLCNEGYEGSGLACDDIDECDDGSAGCDANATCANSDGGFDCTCNEDFEGDGFVCNGTLVYGDTCMEPEPCASGICILGPYNQCSELCNQAIANDCPNVGASGFCVPVSDTDFACVGELDTGFDTDDDILSAGDSATRGINTLTDADLFHLDLPMGSFVISVQPDPDDDIQVEVHDSIGQPIGVLNNGGDGFTEAVVLDTAGGVTFAVVRNVGDSTGNYTISVVPE